MKLSEIMTTHVKTVGPETELREAAQIMKDEGVTMVPVVGLCRIPVGVITDRDIAIRAFAIGMSPSAPVRKAMTSEACTIMQDCDVSEALALMRSAKISRLLVCNGKGQLTGVLSLREAANHCKCDIDSAMLDEREPDNRRAKAASAVTLR